MSIYDRARDALNKATPGPWYTNSRQSRTFQEHVIVSPERGAYTICEMTDENAESAELVALSPELAAEVVRLHEQIAALVGAIYQEAEAKSATGNFLMGEYHGSFAARIREVLERGKA